MTNFRTGTLAAYQSSHIHGSGWSDWIVHHVLSAIIHSAIYSLMLRLMHRLTLGQAIILVAIILIVLFAWGRTRDRW